MGSRFTILPQKLEVASAEGLLIKVLSLAYAFTLVGASLSTLAIIVFSPAYLDRALLSILGGIWAVLGLILLRRGYVRTSASLFILLLFINFTVSAFTSIGIYSFAFSGYVVVVLLAALFLPMRWALLVTVACLVSGLVLAYATRSGWVATVEGMPLSPITTWGLQAIILISVLLFVRANVVATGDALEQAQESEALFRGVFESAAMGVSIVKPNGNFLRVNQHLQHMLGYTETEMQGMSFQDLTHPDDIPVELELVKKLRAGKINEYQIEKRYVRKDGSVFWGRLSASIVTTGDRNAYGVAIVEDIHARKEADLTLRRTEERYRTLVEHFPNGMVALFNRDLEYVLVGGQGLEAAGMQPEDLLGKRLRDVFPPEVYQRDEPALLAALNGEARDNDVTYADRDYRVYTLPVADPDGTISAGMIVTQDVTEIKRAAERQAELELAREKSGMLVDFIEAISHDIKTPLSVINTSLHLLQRHTDPAERQRKIDTIQTQTQTLERYINDLLAVTRLENIPGITMAPLNPNLVVQAVIEELRPKADNQGLNLETDIAPELPHIPANLEDLHRALLNLVDNAINYTPAGGIVRVETHLNTEHVVIRVADTGVGIQAHDLPHIFKRFYRAENARSVNRRGTGLGLAIVHHIIELHGGRIDVQSEPGQGTTFEIHLPVSLAASAS